MGGVPFIFSFSTRIDSKEADIIYLYHRDETNKKSISAGSQKWIFGNKSGYYGLIKAAYRQKESDMLPNFAFNLWQLSQIATSNEMMNIAANAINEAVKQKESKDVVETKEDKPKKVNRKKKKDEME